MRLKRLFSWIPYAAPLVALIPACGFEVGGVPPATFHPGSDPLSSAIFCDVEADRRCSTPEDRAQGIDVARPFETGFWIGESSIIGLDYSADALFACAGQPQAVVFKADFPDGSPVCVNPAQIPQEYPTTNDACKSWCYSEKWIDGDGNPFNCNNIARRSNGAENPFPDACSEAGTLRADFQDPRKVSPTPTPFPVVWTATVGVTVSGSDLTKPATEATQWGNSGAVSTRQLASGDGALRITASETTTYRNIGLGNGNVSVSYEDIEFGLLLRNDGMLQVVEAGVDRGVVGAYATGDTLEVSVEAGVVRYKNNGMVLYTSTAAPVYPLLVDVALYDQNATIKTARTTF